MSIKHLNIKVTGSVQDIGFRYHTQTRARELGLTGFVRNEPDESVYMEAEGDGQKLQELVDWCEQGPEHAQVEKVEAKEGEVKKFKDFRIEY